MSDKVDEADDDGLEMIPLDEAYVQLKMALYHEGDACRAVIDYLDPSSFADSIVDDPREDYRKAAYSGFASAIRADSLAGYAVARMVLLIVLKRGFSEAVKFAEMLR